MHGRCEKCSGTGYSHFDTHLDLRIHCGCPLGKDLKRVDNKAAKALRSMERELAEFNSALNKRARLLFGTDYKLRAARDSE